MAGRYSTAALAGLSVATRVMAFPFAGILGFGQGYQPVVSFNWGARQWKRVRESYSFSVTVAIIGAVLVGGLLAALAKPAVGLFNTVVNVLLLAIVNTISKKLTEISLW